MPYWLEIAFMVILILWSMYEIWAFAVVYYYNLTHYRKAQYSLFGYMTSALWIGLSIIFWCYYFWG